MPWPAAVAALVLIPASGLAAMIALGLLAEPRTPPFVWPIVIPALVPPLVVAFSLWTLVPRLRAVLPAGVAAGFVWSATLLLCLAIAPMLHIRGRAHQQQTATDVKYVEDYAKLPPGSPLWHWTPFLATPNDIQQQAVLDRIRRLDHRQSDAEIMLERGDFPLGFLGRMNLAPTPAICDKTRSLLRRRVEPLVLTAPNSKPYSAIAAAVADAVAAMNWLVGYGCSCDAEARAWETMANDYRNTNFDVYRLVELRDPQQLGRILRNDPDNFSMLTPQSHLRAWLKFAGEPALHDQAMAAARSLQHRTTDAIEMLNQDQYAAQSVLAYLPQLDLETTPALCAAALKELDREYATIYRPRADDPRPYQQLVERMGGGDPFADLVWLAAHRCEADPALNAAEDIVRSYQDSPERSATLAELQQVRHKP
jgi:hypothetical protein